VVLWIFGTGIFLGASLLFVLEPMFARMALPQLGGAPAVWNTAMAFYQAALLAGYAYAHWSTTRLGVRRQPLLHLALLAAALAALPIRVPADRMPPAIGNPLPWLVTLMTVRIGLPFALVAATGPALQRWFAATGHRASADPYFLYAASNAGSLVGLIAYPLALEPLLTLRAQSRLWLAGYGVLVALVLASAALLWRARVPAGARGVPPEALPGRRPVLRQRLRWLVLALVPCSFMLSATFLISTEVAAVPLLWMAPLALYLGSFVLVFARRLRLPHALMARALAILLVPLAIALVARITGPIALLLGLHLAALFLVCMVCHGQLAAERPAAERLTEFYLWVASGGVLGGCANAIVAPLIFTGRAEYGLVLVAAAALLPSASRPASAPRTRLLDLAAPAAVGALVAALLAAARRFGFAGGFPAVLLLVFGPPGVLAYLTSRRSSLRFAGAVGALLLVGSRYEGEAGRMLYAERTFYGTNRVTLARDGTCHRLWHGNTLHGEQSLDPRRRREPLCYYSRSGPLGDVFRAASPTQRARVGVVGLGAGAAACYAQPGEHWSFFELDPGVVRIARDPRYFTFLGACAARVDTVPGDGRLSLAREPDGGFGLLLMDAYSSEAVPVHLLTREALVLYGRKLRPDGWLVFHASNRHIDLAQVMAALAADGGWTALIRRNRDLGPAELASGKAPSVYLVLAREGAGLGTLATLGTWQPPPSPGRWPVWTDQYASVLPYLRWTGL
jgi:SAM-dependent methyltransferase